MQRVHLDGHLRLRRKLSLGAFALCPEPPDCSLVPRGVTLELPAELGDAVAQQPVVEVFASEMRIPRCGLHLKDCVCDAEDRDVEGTAAHVENQNVCLLLFALVRLVLFLVLLLLFVLPVKAVGNGGCCGLVDNAQHVEASNLACILRGLPLRVVEVGGHGDHGLSHSRAQVGLGRLLHLCQHHGGDFLWMELLLHILEVHLNEWLVVCAAV
mmetsp:Transcript_95335/g.221265  ORF Transcript_95335/g.221265 Transcript_95335/m.221265 type:complete len:212 (+) Transcript_95335:1208-1843(+)